MTLSETYLDNAKALAGPEPFEGVKHAAWRSPSNIALVKYWGKRSGQVPENPSLSFTLSHCHTETEVTYSYREKGGAGTTFSFESKPNEQFKTRVDQYLDSLRPYLPFLDRLHLGISSRNSFPHSSGIASSASAMSALALCLVGIEQELYGTPADPDGFYRKAAFLARLGSGSATRSVYGGFVIWGATTVMEGTTDEAGVPMDLPAGNSFRQLKDAILVTSAARKKISSTRGHGLMTRHPWAAARYLQANENLESLVRALAVEEEEKIAAIIENEALSLHALMMSSDPGYRLMNENTWAIIEKIRGFRESSGLFITFTLDAGPNVHMIYKEEDSETIMGFLEEELKPYCENGKWIDDEVGSGPVPFNHKQPWFKK